MALAMILAGLPAIRCRGNDRYPGTAGPRGAARLTEWLAADVCQAERRAGRVREELLTQCRVAKTEPPSAGRRDWVIHSALHQAGQALTLRVTARLPPGASGAARVLTGLLERGDLEGLAVREWTISHNGARVTGWARNITRTAG